MQPLQSGGAGRTGREVGPGLLHPGVRFEFEDEDKHLINNRQQNGRRRGRGGGGQRPSGGGGQGQRDNGNRIDSRARGNANQMYEKYKNLASDAQRQGDRVNTEYFLQFADHYFRVLMDQRIRSDDQSRRPLPVDQFDEDDDYGDEGEPIRAEEQNRGQRDDRGPRDDRGQREDRPRDDRGLRDDRGQRDDRPQRDDRSQRDEPRQREERGYRDDRAPRAAGDGQRQERPYREERRPRDEQPRGDERAPRVESERAGPAPANDLDPAAEPAPRRRGRPRREAVETVAASEDGGALEADRLPPAFNAAPEPATEEAEGEERPRRRRRPPAAEVSLG